MTLARWIFAVLVAAGIAAAVYADSRTKQKKISPVRQYQQHSVLLMEDGSFFELQ